MCVGNGEEYSRIKNSGGQLSKSLMSTSYCNARRSGRRRRRRMTIAATEVLLID